MKFSDVFEVTTRVIEYNEQTNSFQSVSNETLIRP